MNKIIAFFKRLFGGRVEEKVITTSKPSTNKNRKPRYKGKPKPKVTEDTEKLIHSEEPKKNRKPRYQGKPKPKNDGGSPYVTGGGRQPNNTK